MGQWQPVCCTWPPSWNLLIVIFMAVTRYFYWKLSWCSAHKYTVLILTKSPSQKCCCGLFRARYFGLSHRPSSGADGMNELNNLVHYLQYNITNKQNTRTTCRHRGGLHVRRGVGSVRWSCALLSAWSGSRCPTQGAQRADPLCA